MTNDNKDYMKLNEKDKKAWAARIKETIDGWVEGREIQCSGEGSSWSTKLNTDRLQFFYTHEYRVKPEPKYKAWTAEEFLALLKDTKKYPEGIEVIDSRNVSHTLWGITRLHDGRMAVKTVLHNTYLFEELLRAFILRSGAPCGVEIT